jgi:hypothetical protein
VSRLGTQSEIDKLAETLSLAPAELEFLAEVPPQELRSLRISIYERLFGQDAVLFERLALFAVHMPPRAAAMLAERVMGPMITARVAAELPYGPALAIARQVSIPFFADTCEFLDPRRTRELIIRMPLAMTVAVALELADRRAFTTISRFVDFVSDEQTRAVVDAIDDEATILRVGFYMGSKNRMDHLFALLPRDRLERLIQRVQEERNELLPAFLSVLIHVSYRLKRELGDILAEQPPAVLAGYVRASHEQRLWRDVLPVVAGMSNQAKQAVVNLPILRERAVQAQIIDTADRERLWGDVLGLVAMMDDSNRDAVATITAELDAAALERACDAALMGERWDTLLDLVRRMPDSKHAELAEIVERRLAPHDPELVARLARQASQLGLTSLSRAGVSTSSAYS